MLRSCSVLQATYTFERGERGNVPLRKKDSVLQCGSEHRHETDPRPNTYVRAQGLPSRFKLEQSCAASYIRLGSTGSELRCSDVRVRYGSRDVSERDPTYTQHAGFLFSF
jgi:hypothetical protein